jgi:hypothetical protein
MGTNNNVINYLRDLICFPCDLSCTRLLRALRVATPPSVVLRMPSAQRVTTQSVYKLPLSIITSRVGLLCTCEPPPMIFALHATILCVREPRSTNSSSLLAPLHGSKTSLATFVSPSLLIIGFEPLRMTSESHIASSCMLFLLLGLSMLHVEIAFAEQHQTLEGAKVPSLFFRPVFDPILHHAQSLLMYSPLHGLLPRLIKEDLGGHPTFPTISKQFFGNLLFLVVFRFLNFWGHFEGLNDVFSRPRTSLKAEGFD